MKRAAEHTEGPYGRDKLFRRQDPVSCQFCRRKKLKCDRGSPCSNCRARKLTCSSALENAQSSRSGELADPRNNSPPRNQNIDELNDRVKKLEQLLTNQSQASSRLPTSSGPPKIYDPKPNQNPVDKEYSKTVSWLETDAFEHMPATGETTFESVADGRVADTFGSFIFSLTKPRIAPSLSQHFSKMLPARSRGRELLEYYFNHISWIYHIIHVPTVERQFDNLYTKLEQNQQPDYGHLALISTLFALSAYFSSPSAGLFTDIPDQMLQCRRWTLLSQDALSAANCLATPTVETIQSLILISQHLMPNIGAIATLRTLTATIIHTARAMSLHQVDSLKNKKLRQNTKVDWVEIETKRRLWWHITSTDWILSFMSGSQCGTYMIQPQQMNVDWPSNVDDIAISADTVDENYAQPIGVVTESTYFVLRIRFSIVARGIVDSAWEAQCDLDDMPYELVLEADKNLNGLCAELDAAFKALKTTKPSDMDENSAVGRRYSLLQRQHDMCLFGIHTRITRLHRAYLLRGAQDPRYAYSRMVCLRSARTVIEIGKAMTVTRKDITSIKIWTLNHHVFVSTVILVMDYCFNRDEPRAKERREEIMDCFRLLESSKQECTIATRGLSKLRHMLRKERADGESGSSRPSSAGAPAVAPSLHPVKEQVTAVQRPVLEAAQVAAPPQAHQNIQDMNFQFPVTGFDDPPPYQWEEWDYYSLGNINFDVNLDASEFEALFQSTEGSNQMF